MHCMRWRGLAGKRLIRRMPIAVYPPRTDWVAVSCCPVVKAPPCYWISSLCMHLLFNTCLAVSNSAVQQYNACAYRQPGALQAALTLVYILCAHPLRETLQAKAVLA